MLRREFASTFVLLGWVILSATEQAAAQSGFREPLFDQARSAVARLVKDANPGFLAVRIRNVEHAGQRVRVVCGFVRKADGQASMPWIYLEATQDVYILASRADREATRLIAALCW